MCKKILVIGSMNIDMTVRLKSLPKAGETVLTQKIQYDLGGKGANQASAAARLGGNVKMLGCVGDDSFGTRQIESLNALGIDTSDIKIAAGTSTGTAIVCVDEYGSNCIMVEQGANLKCDEEYIRKIERAIGECDYLLVQMEIPYESLYWAIRYAHSAGKCVILNPAPAPERIPEEIYQMIDYLTPNETELFQLTGLSETEITSPTYRNVLWEGAQKLLQKGVGTVIVTMGEEGCGVFYRDHAEYYPSVKVDVVDTTGAGDCFNGAFAAALAEGNEESEALQFAILASAISVTKHGAQGALPTKSDVENSLHI